MAEDCRGPGEIGILLYPGVQLAAVHGLTDLFAVAGLAAGAGAVPVSHWTVGGDGSGLCAFRAPAGAPSPPTVVIAPPTMVDLPDEAACGRISAWLAAAHGRGATLVAICSGLFLVAGTGLLDGCRVSTHQSCAVAFGARYPGVTVDLSARMTEHGAILTAGGFMAWVDVGLLLVERLMGRGVRDATARFVLAEAAETRGAGRFVPRYDHRDPAVARAQEVVHLTDGQGVSLAQLAAAARLERRTFIRRFASATGMAPIEYCRSVRIARACELLAAGNMPLKAIAEAVGYADVSAFGRAFRRAHGVSPAAYRRRNGGALFAGAAAS